MSIAIRGAIGADSRHRAMRLLLLAGTPEASQIAGAVTHEPAVSVMTSRAQPRTGAERSGRAPRIGRWRDEAEFAGWLRENAVDAVLDASHPYDTAITRRSASVCRSLDIPFAQYLRPGWTPGPGDDWTFLNSGSDAARHIPPGDVVCLATGHHGLAEFEGLGDRPVMLRVRDRRAGPCPFRNGRYMVGRTDRSAVAEMVGFRVRGVKWLVARNTGGAWTRTAVEAARRLGLPVGMIRRPLQPEVPRVRSVHEAIGWVSRRI
jgi:precorrin-6A/cobalt-precorrin-6A reductase